MRICMIGILMAVMGCTDNVAHHDVAVTNVNSCVREAIELTEHSIERIMRWVKPEEAYRNSVNESNLVEVANCFVSNTMPRINCVAPLFVKFEKSLRKKPFKEDYGGLRDLRENEDGQFEIEAFVIGKRDVLLDNRFYFIFNQGDVTTAWVRRFDNIRAGMGCSPKLRSIARCTDDIGAYEIRWSGLAPIFINEDAYGIEHFLKQAMSGNATLCWGSGKWGLYEGKHVYETERFVRWFDCFRDSLIPLNVIFAARDTYIFSIDVNQRAQKTDPSGGLNAH